MPKLPLAAAARRLRQSDPAWWPPQKPASPQTRDRVADLLRDHQGLSFAGSDVKRLLGPLVYVVLRQQIPLYVGMSRVGASRPFSPTHPAMAQLEDTDDVLLWPTATVADAIELERLLISRLQPVLNQRLRTSELRHLLGLRPRNPLLSYRAAGPQPSATQAALGARSRAAHTTVDPCSQDRIAADPSGESQSTQ